MLRGFLAGGLWGTVIGGVVLALTSQLASVRDLSPGVTSTVAEQDAVPEAPSGEQQVITAGAGEALNASEEAPRETAEAGDEISAPMLDTAPPETPVAEAATDQSAPSEGVAETPRVAVVETPSAEVAPETDAPAPASTAPEALAAAPAFAAPESDTPPQTDVETAYDATPRAVVASLSEAESITGEQPVAQAAPDPVETDPAVAVAAAPEADDASGADVSRDAAAPRVAALAQSEAPNVSENQPVVQAAPSAVEVAPEVAAAQAPEAGSVETDVPRDAEAAPRVVALVPTETPSASGDQPVAEAAPQPVDAAPEIVAGAAPESDVNTTEIAEGQAPQTPVPALGPPVEPEQAGAEPSIDVEVPRIGVVSANGEKQPAAEPQVLQVTDAPTLPGRRPTSLPQVGADATEEAAAEPEVEVVADETPQAEAGEVSALDRNRIAFEAPDGAALIAVVLVHESGPALELSAGEETMPLTVAVSAGLPDAGTIAQTYREAGHEVALIPDLPRGATAQDVAVALPVNLEQVPVAVALMDADGNGFQGNRDATTGVVATASDLGLGVLTWPKGFNTADRVARQEGVPSATVFRALEETEPDAIGRALEQAAFRARQDGGIVVVGRANAGMLEGLKAWNAFSRRSDTALAPISAVLSGG